MAGRKLRFTTALLPSGWHDDVLVTIGKDGMISGVEPGAPGRSGAVVRGVAVPGMPNVHSHAHQRAMAGLAERSGPGADSFWSWRDIMYGFALKMNPDDLEAVAAQLYVEALKSGYTSIGEFQYLHHAPDGGPYEALAEMSLRCLAAAETTGIAITLLPALYCHGGCGGQPPLANQRRFVNGTKRFVTILEQLDKPVRANPRARLGIAPHSLRAVTGEELVEALSGIDRLRPGAPVHMHVAEQIGEVDDCVAFCGKRPVELLMSLFELSPRWCLIHATHMNEAETGKLAGSGAIAGLCPTTEANLGDGIFNGVPFLRVGGAIALGSDSHICMSPAEEIRQLEYSQRLHHRARNVLAGGPNRSTGRRLHDAALAGGAAAIAQPQGSIAQGMRADIVVLDETHPALIGRDGDSLLDSWIFSGGNGCVKHVFVSGEQLVENRRHRHERAIAARFQKSMMRLKEMP